MTFAEVIFLVGGGAAIYILLRPFQRWLAVYLTRKFSARRPRLGRPTIDVTDFTSHPSPEKDDDRL